MATVVGDDDTRAGRASHVCNVGVVDATTGDRVSRRTAKHREPIGRGQVVDRHPTEDLFFKKRDRIRGRNPELGGKTRGDRKNSRQQCQAVAGDDTRFSATACIND